ncbi:hypothetical protein GJAV_G00150130 [Gymnothorax javanicus]|nr:hypothetical protein GJAV_G00150130 [Gymnothorax javanicus]
MEDCDQSVNCYINLKDSLPKFYESQIFPHAQPSPPPLPIFLKKDLVTSNRRKWSVVAGFMLKIPRILFSLRIS